MLWEVVDDNVVEDPNRNGEIGLQMFGFNCFDVYGVG